MGLRPTVAYEPTGERTRVRYPGRHAPLKAPSGRQSKRDDYWPLRRFRTGAAGPHVYIGAEMEGPPAASSPATWAAPPGRTLPRQAPAIWPGAPNCGGGAGLAVPRYGAKGTRRFDSPARQHGDQGEGRLRSSHPPRSAERRAGVRNPAKSGGTGNAGVPRTTLRV